MPLYGGGGSGSSTPTGEVGGAPIIVAEFDDVLDSNGSLDVTGTQLDVATPNVEFAEETPFQGGLEVVINSPTSATIQSQAGSAHAGIRVKGTFEL